jgi:MSHA biogenesis protein MshM
MAMYLQYFGLNEAPFSLTPDTDFFFDYQSHQEALNVLLVALRSGEGFIKVTGEVGTGKTLVCRKLMGMLEAEFVIAYIPNPMLNPNAFRSALADELEIQFARNIGQHRLLKLINERLIELNREGRKVIVLIDEAQTMPEDTMESLRLLTNLETEKFKLMQVVLFGQPELDARLNQDSVRQLKQRITFSYVIKPMSREHIGGYIQHRMIVAGFDGADLFTTGAVKEIARASKGIPRLINILSHKSLLATFGKGDRSVDKPHVRMAIKDTDQSGDRKGKWFTWRLGMLLGMLVASASALMAGVASV